MKVTIELDDDIIYAIAQKKGVENGYNALSDPDVDGDLTQMYAIPFADGMRYVLTLIEQSNGTDNQTKTVS